MKQKSAYIFIFLLLSGFFIALVPLPKEAYAQGTFQIVSVDPSNNSVDVPLRTHPTIVFSEPVNTGTLTGSVNGLPIVPFQVMFDGSNQTLTLDLGDMEYSKTYTIIISSSVQDTNGNQLGSDYSFSFTTAAGASKRPASTIIVPSDMETGKTYTLTGRATGYIWQRDANNPLELRHWDENGVDIGGDSMLHPTVLYFPEGYDGYKFYLIYTPYPPEPDENPSLMRSNDGVTFTATNVSNPLFTYGTQPVYDSHNLADPEVVRVGNTWMLFYEMEQTEYAHIGLALSTDGINYAPYGGPYDPARPLLPFPTDGNPVVPPSFDTWYEQDTQPNDQNPRLGEPAVIFKDGAFHMWYASYNIGQGSMGGSPLSVYANATDPRGPWTKYGPVDVNGFFGHEDVVYDPERNLYVMISMSDNPYITLGDAGINVHTSPSINGPWTGNPNNPVFNAQGGWEGASVYRSSLVQVGTQWYLYYSANPGDYLNNASPKIGLAREALGVRKAEISTNGGSSWTQLTVDSNGNWNYNWTPSSNGTYSIKVRVTDDWMTGEPSQTTATVGFQTTQTNPILVVVNSSFGSFGRFAGEILKAEGIMEYQLADISQVDASFIAGFDTIILTTMNLTTAQATLFQNYVLAGGNLIAFKPDTKLAPILGLTPTGTSTSEGYIRVDNTTDIGKGIVSETIQFHGAADNYNLNGASVIATLCEDASTPTPYPAVTVYVYGTGTSMFFAYDLPKSIVYLRQGNPAQANMETDGVPGIRPADLLAGGWLDVSKVPIPQADEQMRLLSNAIIILNYNKKPLPRLWYFPGFQKTMFIMTADSDGGSLDQINQELAEIKARGANFSLYMTDWLDQDDVQSWIAQGTDISWHMFWPSAPAGYQAWYDTYTDILNQFQSAYGFSPTTIRHHAIVWSDGTWMDYAASAKIQEAHGIHLDLNYYHYGAWLDPGDGFKNGWMTGSGIPMKFADENGTIYDSYQVNTNFPDEAWNLFASSGVEAAAIAASFFNRSNNGFYSAFVGNFHPVSWAGERETYGLELMDYAQSYGIPIWSAAQLLDFTDAKNSASFEDITYSSGRLDFVLNLPVAVSNLTVMIPYDQVGQVITGITLDSAPQSFGTQTINGITYAWFPVSSVVDNNSYEITATYGPDTTPPEITVVSPVNGTVLSPATSSVTITIATDENADCRYSLTDPSFDFYTEGTDFTSGQGSLVHSFTLSGLQMGETYNLYYKANDTYGNINSVSAVHTFSVDTASTVWWDSSWRYRKPVVLTENSGAALSDFQVNVVVSYVASKMKSDFSDLRFTDSDRATLLPYWIESYTSAVSASVWVRVPSIPASGTKTIYMYYGNSGATSASDGTATFDFFDDFEDGSIDSNKWVTSGTVQETGGSLQVGEGAGSKATQNTLIYPLFSSPYVLRSRSLVSLTDSVWAYVGFADSGITQFALAPHSESSYYTYDGLTEQKTDNTAGLTSYAIYDISWTSSGVSYYQDGALRAMHANSPTVPMGAYLGVYNDGVYARSDWILIHKYASVSPSFVTGSEETPAWSLTVNVSGQGTTNSTGTTVHYEYTNVTVLATPDSDYQLSHWLLNGTDVGSSNPYTLNMTANYNLAAVFAPVGVQVSLTVDVSGNGGTNATGTTMYNQYTNVTVLATPGSGYFLSHWLLNGTNVGLENPFTLNMTENFNLTAVFTPVQVNLTVEVSGHGITNSTGTAAHNQFANVTVLATADSGYLLSYWLLNGTDVGSANPYTVNMTGNYNLTAVFASVQVSLTVGVSGQGATNVTGTVVYDQYTNVTVLATPSSGYFLSHWLLNGTDVSAGNPYTLNMTNSFELTAVFAPIQHSLTVNVSGQGVTNATGTVTYDMYSNVTVLATPDAGYKLDHWTLNGIDVGSANPYALNMTDSFELIAVFVPVQHTLTVSVSGNGATNATGTLTYDEYTDVTVLATPDSGYRFDHWLLNDTNVGSANPYTLNMTDTFELTAVFVPIPHTLTVSVIGNGVTNATGTVSYDEYSNVTVLATPNSGFRLDHWLLNGTDVGSANPYTLNMTDSYELAAVFAAIQHTLAVNVSGQGTTNATGAAAYDMYSNVTVLATPDSGFFLAHWLLNGTNMGSVNPYVLNMTDSYELTAVFVPIVNTLTVIVSGNGATNATGTTSYDMYSNVTVLATPGSGYRLDHWLLNGTGVGSVNPYTLNMTDSFELTAVFVPIQHALTVSVVGQGATNATGTVAYDMFTYVTVLATPNSGFKLDHWLLNGTDVGATNPYELNMTGSYELVAVFTAIKHSLTVSVSGNGVTNATGTVVYDMYSNVTVLATPDAGWRLDHWLVNGTVVGSANPFELNMTNSFELTAVFVRIQVDLAVTVTGQGGTNATGTSTHEMYSNVTVLATAGSGYRLDHWLINGTNVGSANPYTLNMTDNFELLAVFVPIVHTLTVTVSGNGVTNATGTTSYNMFSNVTVLAAADAGWKLDHWMLNGTNDGAVNPYELNITDSFELTAVFVPIQLSLTVSVSGNGATNLTGTATYDMFSNVTVLATPSSGFFFSHWLLNSTNVGSVNPYVLNMTESYELIAVFAPVQVTLTVNVSGNGVTNDTGTTVHDQFSNVTVLAIADSGYFLSYWLLNGTNVGSVNPYSLNMTDNYNLVAVFMPVQVSLTVGVSGHGATNATGTFAHDQFTNTSVLAIPDSGYFLSAWLLNGTDVGSANPFTLNMTDNYSLIAVFAPVQVSLTVQVSGRGVTNNTGTFNHDQFTNVTVLATPDSGYFLSHWTLNGTNVGSENPLTVNMTDNYELTAVFLPVQVSLTVSVSGHGVTNVTGTANHDQYTIVTVLATPDVGYYLSHWLLNGTSVGTLNPYILNMTENCNLTAVFAIIQFQVTFAQTGLDVSTSSGLVLTVNGTEVGYSELPYSVSVDYGDSLVYSYNATVLSDTAGKRFVLGSVTPSSPLVGITSSQTVTGTFETQYQVTFSVNPSGAGITSPLGPTVWQNAGTNISISATPNDGYAFSSWTTSGLITVSPSSSSIANATINGAGTITANFVENVPPSTTASVTSGTRGNNGWYVSSIVEVTLTASDADSGVANITYRLDGGAPITTSGSSVIITISGDAVHSLTYYATDNAGNQESPQSLTVKIDATPPSVSGAPTTSANANGWWNSSVVVHFVGSDSLSGIASVTSDVTVATEGLNRTVTGTATDLAGNSATFTVININIDLTAPVLTALRNPSSNVYGWNNESVTVDFIVSDGLSGLASYSGNTTLTSEGANQLVNGSATDLAGNSASLTISVSIDKTAPTITGSRSPGPNVNGWNNESVTVTFIADDGLSGLASYSGNSTLSGEGADQSVLGIATDKAGNSATFNVGGINIDKTVPTISGSRTPSPNAHGWNNESVIVTFLVDDALSGVASASGNTTLTDDGAGQSVTGVVTDRAGNLATFTVSNINIDKTAPSIVALRNPSPNSYGWNNESVTVEFAVSDALSGLASYSGNTTLTGEGADQHVNGIATDLAGNSVLLTVVVSIDLTPPAITGLRNPGPNAFGWNNESVTVGFIVSDGLSGLRSYSGNSTVTAEGANQLVNGTVTDLAGNSASLTVPVSIDLTAPTITGSKSPDPNVHGWNNQSVTVTFIVGDVLSGVASASGNETLTDEGAGQSVIGVVVDRAGNSASATVSGINIDKTAPSISALRSPEPNAFGWNNESVTVDFIVSDGLSGLASYSGNTTLTGEGASQLVNGAVTDLAGNSASLAVSVSIDKTAPSIIGSLSPGPNVYGWNNGSVTVTFVTDDALSGVASSLGNTTLASEGASQSVSGWVTDRAGNSASASVSGINIDTTAPSISGSRSPGPNGAGWNNGSVTVTFLANDGLSGVASSSGNTTLSGEGAGQSVTGIVTDKAGNSASLTIDGINIDMTAPVVTITGPANGAYYKTIALPTGSFTVSEVNPYTTVESGYSTVEGVRTYTVTATDAAGNTGSANVTYTVDNTAPVVTISAPVNEGYYRSSTVPSAAFSVVDVNPTAVVESGYSTEEGVHTYTVTATDAAGNVGEASVTYTVDNTQYSLTVQVSGSGATNSTGTAVYYKFTNVTVLATAGSGFFFDHWLLNSTNIGSVNPFILNMTDSFELTAVFVPIQHTLTVNVVGSGVTNATGTAVYDEFSSVTVLATPNSGYRIDHWTLNGTDVGSGNPYVVSMTDSFTLTVFFVPIQRTLTVVSAHGSPTPGVGANIFNDGTAVTANVSSPVNENDITYVCTGWTGTGSVPASGSGTSVTFTISEDSSITWTWVARYNQSLQLQPGWNMISFSVLPDDASFESILAGIGYSQVVTWDGTQYVTPSTAEAGRGYWVLVLSPTVINITGSSVESFELDLPAGWTMIGSIYNSTVNADDVFPAYYQLSTWNGTSYITATTIEPGKGYWALVLVPTRIRVE